MRNRTGCAVLDAMEAVCSWVDGLPEWTWRVPLLHRLGCPRGLTVLAWHLDDRFHLGWIKRESA